MILTDKNILKKYDEENRLWQGVPSIEVTVGGRMFCSFYSGGTTEEIGNYILVYTSDDKKKFSLYLVVAPKEGERCYDSQLWIDPFNRLWLTWSEAPSDNLYAAVCNEPDAENIVFGEERIIGKGVMMNKPTILSSGEWLFPIAVWRKGIHAGGFINKIDMPAGSYVYRSIDGGKTFTPYGYADVPNRSYDEHIVIELTDGTLQMLVRTNYGIGVSYSYDGGKNWTKGIDSTLGGPSSRFCIRRLKSGRLMLINHYKFDGRNNLTAMLSEDDGKTFPYKLLIDGRNNVSYPDLKEADDGYIYIIYDRERGCFEKKMEDTLSRAREILYAKINEQDIIDGKISEGSSLQNVISKLGEYNGDFENPYQELQKISDNQLAEKLISDGEFAIDKIFDMFPMNCIYLKDINNAQLDDLIELYNNSNYTDIKVLEKILKIVRNIPKKSNDFPIVEQVIMYIKQHFTEDFSVADLAMRYKCSIYHLCHTFKKHTGITIVVYKNQLRLSHAKFLLFHTNESIMDIALQSGYDNESYFCKIFMREEHVSPMEYRTIITRGIK